MKHNGDEPGCSLTPDETDRHVNKRTANDGDKERGPAELPQSKHVLNQHECVEQDKKIHASGLSADVTLHTPLHTGYSIIPEFR